MNYHHIYSDVLLKKLLTMQHALLLKEPLVEIIHKEKAFFLEFANAEFIGLSLQGRDAFFEFTCKVGDDHGLIHLIQTAKIKTETIVETLTRFDPPIKVIDRDEVCSFFNPMGDCEYIHTVLDGKKIVLSFLESEIGDDRTQATVVIILKAEHFRDENIKKSYEVVNVIWEAIAPFYDHKTGMIYQHCIHEDLKFEQLSSREREIAISLAHGFTQAQIAKNTSLSINTIKTHIKSIYLKFGVTSRIDFINRIYKR